MSLIEAQEHYQRHTWHVMTKQARKQMRRATWSETDGIPTLVGDGLTLYFGRTVSGRLFATLDLWLAKGKDN